MRIVGSLLAALVTALPPASAWAAGEEPPVTLSLRAVPLRAALTQVYSGTPKRLKVPPSIPDVPITAELRGISRPAALRFLMRVSGIAGITGTETADAVVVTQSAPVAIATGSDSGNVFTDTGSTAAMGVTTGPGGAAVPSFTGTRLSTLRRVPLGVPVYLGGISQSQASSSRSGAPFLPFGSRMSSRTSTSGDTFVTITVIPDPVPERPRKRR